MSLCRLCKEAEADPAVNKGLWCRPCKRQYDRDYWAKTKPFRNERKKINTKEIRRRNRQFVWEYLLSHSCVDCNFSNPIALTFDHLFDKKYNVSEAVSSASLETLKTEISKCEVRCANCHLIRTSEQFNWYKDIQRDIV